ncbi:hypothetical protein S40288_01727 [Stachybotrys chartarum IBT 40288]|nr:hypothetical protein S40288_01727 [Stachybotrys chartarum IBT 40288]
MEAKRSGSRHRITFAPEPHPHACMYYLCLLGAYKYRNPMTVKSGLRTLRDLEPFCTRYLGGGQPSGFACTSLSVGLSHQTYMYLGSSYLHLPWVLSLDAGSHRANIFRSNLHERRRQAGGNLRGRVSLATVGNMFRSLKKKATNVFRRNDNRTNDTTASTASLEPYNDASGVRRQGSSRTSQGRGSAVTPPASKIATANRSSSAVQDMQAPRYVPFVEAAPFQPKTATTKTSFYGNLRPGIMAGFGADDDPIWLFDDEEIDDDTKTGQRAFEGSGTRPNNAVQLSELVQWQRTKKPTPRPTQQPSGAPLYTTSPSLEDLLRHTRGDSSTSRLKQSAGSSARHVQDNMPRINGSSTLDNWSDESIGVYTMLQHSPIPDHKPSSSCKVAEALVSPGEDQFRNRPRSQSTMLQTQPPKPPATKQRGYAPIPASILSGFDSDDDDVAASPGSTSDVQSLYVNLSAWAGRFLAVARNHPQEDLEPNMDTLADDFSFGQRYHQSSITSNIVVTRRRIRSEQLSGSRECIVCTDTKPNTQFPRFSITATCAHAPGTCLDCIKASIRSDMNSKLWTDIRCPECREFLDYADIQKYSDPTMFLRYENLALRAAMSQADDFFWCTSGCGSGQVHESGTDQPIVVCLHCGHRSCYQHNVPWHQDLTCDEYERFLEDPENFRSQLELDNEEWARRTKAIHDMDRTLARELFTEEEQQARESKAQQKAERERAQRAATMARKAAARRKKEDEKSLERIRKTTKTCPGCGWAIEKRDGW